MSTTVTRNSTTANGGAISTAVASAPVLPRDARLIALLLAANGAEDCEEGVVRMLVEFAHRYTTDILTDALMYAEHARSGQPNPPVTAATPSLDDVRLAVQARTEGAQVPKEFLLQLATTVNANPLPPVPEVYGVRLPAPAHRLTAPNFTLAPRQNRPQPPPPLSANTGTGEGQVQPAGDLTANFAFDLTQPFGSMQQDTSGSGLGGLQQVPNVGRAGEDEDDDDEDDDDEGLFGDDISGDDDDDDDDMVDVTSGQQVGAGSNGDSSGNGLKRKADSDEDEYD